MTSKEENINLIAGRIMDEYRKHPLLEWHKIAASKIHSQWFEYYENQNKELTDKIADLKNKESLKESLLLKAFNAGIDCEFGNAPSFEEWYNLEIKNIKND